MTEVIRDNENYLSDDKIARIAQLKEHREALEEQEALKLYKRKLTAQEEEDKKHDEDLLQNYFSTININDYLKEFKEWCKTVPRHEQSSMNFFRYKHPNTLKYFT